VKLVYRLVHEYFTKEHSCHLLLSNTRYFSVACFCVFQSGAALTKSIQTIFRAAAKRLRFEQVCYEIDYES
jgi:hypothetical protein